MAYGIRRNDMVVVVAGKDRGKQGRVVRMLPRERRIVVEGVNMITRHIKSNPNIRQSGRIQREAAIHVSNLVLICNKCNKPTKPVSIALETGARVRGCPKCKEVIDDIG